MIVSTLGYLRKNGQTLMLHRNKRDSDFHKGKYNGLGGKLEPMESPEECMKREVFEESGFTVMNMRLRGIVTFPLFDGRDDWLTFIYEIHEFEGTLKENDEGSLHWVDDSSLFDLNLWAGDVHFLEWIYKGNAFFSGKFIYRDKQFVSHEVAFYND